MISYLNYREACIDYEAMNIWLRREGMENGPYTLEQVWEFVENGDVTLEDEAWCEGLED